VLRIDPALKRVDRTIKVARTRSRSARATARSGPHAARGRLCIDPATDAWTPVAPGSGLPRGHRRRRRLGLGDHQLMFERRRWCGARARRLRTMALEHWDPLNVYDDATRASIVRPHLERVGRMPRRGKGQAEPRATSALSARRLSPRRERGRRRRLLPRASAPGTSSRHRGSRVEEHGRGGEARAAAATSVWVSADAAAARRPMPRISAFASGRLRSVTAATRTTASAQCRARDRGDPRDRVDVVLRARHVGS
jgi:hypothetical protein